MKTFRFDKSLRLLKASDFKAVFDDARFKVSSPQVLFLARPNDQNSPRLGLVVSKKHAKLAVQRNRIKRIARESFRLQQHRLGGIDTIVLARAGLVQLDNEAMNQMFAQLWKQLKRRYDKAQQTPARVDRDKP